MCIVEYDTARKPDVYGNHYIIACINNDKVESQTKKLRAREPIYSTKSYPCAVLKNYVDIRQRTLADVFPDINRYDFRDPIMLGKMEKPSNQSITKNEFFKQTTNLRAGDLAKCLLVDIRRRLSLSTTYETVFDSGATEAVNLAFTLISSYLPALQKEGTPPLDIKELMLKLNNQFISFVHNYYNYLKEVYRGGAEIFNHGSIYTKLQQIYNCMKDQSYQTVNGVFCSVYENPSADKSLICVTNNNFDKLLDIFLSRGFTTLKFIKVPPQEDDDWYALIKNEKWKISFTTNLNVLEIPPNNNSRSVLYKTSCVNGHTGDYYWVCTECQNMIKVNQQAKLVCTCGIGNNPVTVNPECYQCVLKNRTSEKPVITVDTNLSPVEEAFVCNRPADQTTAETSCIHFTKGLVTTEPVTFSICSLTTALKKKTEKCIKVQKFWHFYALHAKLSAPKPHTYTVLVIGSSGAGKSTLLNSIYCMQQHGTLEHAANNEIKCILPVTLEETGEAFDGIYENNDNEHYASVGQSVTQHPKDYVLDYGTFKIRFVDTPGITDTRGFDQDAENIKFIQEHLLKLKEVHAVMFVIKNSEVKLSAEFENTMLALFGILPRTAIQNCFFVYTFAAPDFQPGAARTPLTTLLAKFSKQHNVELSLDTSNEYCVDNGILRKLLHCQKSSERFAISSYADYWKANSESISRMFQDVTKVNPILCEDFKLAAKMKELGDVLRPYGKGDKGKLTSDAKRLMASVANGSLHGIAIYCRNKSEGEKSIGNDEWETVQEVWRAKDEGVLKKAAEIDALIKDLQQAQRDAAPGGTVRDVGIVDTVEYLPVYESNKDIGHRSEDHLTEANDQPEPSVMPIAVTVYAERFGNSVRSISCHQEVDLQKTSTDYGSLLDERVFNVREPIIDVEHVSIDVANNDNLVSNADVNAPDVQLSSLLAPTECQTTPLVTILVIGTSETNNKAFIECVYRGKQKELEQASKSYAPVKEPGRRTTNGCIIDYGSYEVGFISLVDSDSPINWKLYPEVHGFIFVTSVYSSYPPDDLQLRKSLGRVPRNALKNCCIVNVVISTSAASTALSEYMIKFHSEHALEDEINHFSVDSDLIKRHEYTTRHYVDTLDTIKSNVEELIFTIAESPVTFNELKVTECLTQIGDTLFAKVTITQAEKRLLATVVSKTMSVLAQRIRKKYGNNIAAPLSDHEWHAADNWEISENLIRYVREINGYINPVMNFEQQSDISSTRL
uniref:G domain-containing protein n=1 Tax=Panagrellus redivivus TaxID=6233 RepID=A0A7E4ZQY9_PANRE